MFNLLSSLKKSDLYNSSFSFFSQGFFQICNVFIIVKLIRNQVPEIRFLQLIPGYYLILLFLFILLFFLFTNFFTFFPSLLDNQKTLGSKILNKNFYFINNKFLYFFFIFSFFASTNYILPNSLDAFYAYSEKTLENFWSFNDLLKIEFFLLLSLNLISQLPLFSYYFISNEIKIFKFLKYFKFSIFFILLLSGFLTPTVDLYSQILFIIFSMLIYGISIHFLIKRIFIKYLSLTFLN